jgi:ABC-type glutathione transport system ATPase component
VSGLTALVAGLSSGVKRAAVGSGAVSGDVAELAAGIALHSLSLAITGKVVGTTALVASGRARATSETTSAVTTGEATTAHGSTAAHGTRADGVGASASKVTGLATVVASAAGAGAAQTKSRAVSLDVAETLAVVALLGLSGSGKRASVGLVAGLLAVVAETLSRRADLSVVANIATLVASTSRERRHCEDRGLCGSGGELDG